MIENRAQLIKAGRAVVIASVDQQVLEPGQRIYLLKCAGDTLVLDKTGLFSHVGNRSFERSVASSKKDDPVVLIFVHWDGGKGAPSRHPVDRVGLTLTLETHLVVTSLVGITWKDGRPHRMRALHTPS